MLYPPPHTPCLLASDFLHLGITSSLSKHLRHVYYHQQKSALNECNMYKSNWQPLFQLNNSLAFPEVRIHSCSHNTPIHHQITKHAAFLETIHFRHKALQHCKNRRGVAAWGVVRIPYRVCVCNCLGAVFMFVCVQISVIKMCNQDEDVLGGNLADEGY